MSSWSLLSWSCSLKLSISWKLAFSCSWCVWRRWSRSTVVFDLVIFRMLSSSLLSRSCSLRLSRAKPVLSALVCSLRRSSLLALSSALSPSFSFSAICLTVSARALLCSSWSFKASISLDLSSSVIFASSTCFLLAWSWVSSASISAACNFLCISKSALSCNSCFFSFSDSLKRAACATLTVFSARRSSLLFSSKASCNSLWSRSTFATSAALWPCSSRYWLIFSCHSSTFCAAWYWWLCGQRHSLASDSNCFVVTVRGLQFARASKPAIIDGLASPKNCQRHREFHCVAAVPTQERVWLPLW